MNHDHWHWHWRRHSILAPLAATAFVGSLLYAFHHTDGSQGSRRQLGARGAARRAVQTQLFSFADPKTVVLRTDAHAVAAPAGSPNVIYLQHESLSGSIALHTAEGVKSMPFFQDRMAHDPDLYVFEHVRAASGITLDAMPALMTGCMPHTPDALQWVQAPGRSVGYDFRRRGYRTASFSSRKLDYTIKTGAWKVLYDMLVGSMDKVVDPLSKKWPQDNEEGTDDRRMLPLFEEWLRELAEDPSRPFYAQMYNFNQHYPYMKKEGAPKSTERYYQSLTTTDEFLQLLFEILDKAGRLQNTIIVGSGDHGEEPFKKTTYARLRALNSNILQPVSYIYYPRHLLSDPSVAVRLRSNTQRLVHTLDLYQTVHGILGRAVAPTGEEGGRASPPLRRVPGCIAGVDLTEVDVPEDRAVISWNLFSSDMGLGRTRRFWALSTKDRSLYHRQHAQNFPELKQGKNNTYVLEYGDCIRDTSPGNLCQAALTEESKDYFRDVIQWIKTTPLYEEDVKTSKLVEFFSEMVGWKEMS